MAINPDYVDSYHLDEGYNIEEGINKALKNLDQVILGYIMRDAGGRINPNIVLEKIKERLNHDTI